MLKHIKNVSWFFLVKYFPPWPFYYLQESYIFPWIASRLKITVSSIRYQLQFRVF